MYKDSRVLYTLIEQITNAAASQCMYIIERGVGIATVYFSARCLCKNAVFFPHTPPRIKINKNRFTIVAIQCRTRHNTVDRRCAVAGYHYSGGFETTNFYDPESLNDHIEANVVSSCNIDYPLFRIAAVRNSTRSTHILARSSRTR